MLLCLQGIDDLERSSGEARQFARVDLIWGGIVHILPVMILARIAVEPCRMGTRPVRQPGRGGPRRLGGLRLQADDPAARSQPRNEVRCRMAGMAPRSADQPRLPTLHGRAGRSAHVADVDGAADAELPPARLLAGSLLGPPWHIR